MGESGDALGLEDYPQKSSIPLEYMENISEVFEFAGNDENIASCTVQKNEYLQVFS